MICALGWRRVAMAEIVPRAAGKFPEGMPPKERTERQDVLWKNFPTRMNLTGNEEFFAVPEQPVEVLWLLASNSRPVS